MDPKADIIGDEKRLGDILSDEDVVPLLRIAVDAGAGEAKVEDDAGRVLWRQGERQGAGAPCQEHLLRLEGEPVGRIAIAGGGARGTDLETLALILFHSVNAILKNNLKRILTTQVHTKVMDLSYDELVAKNRELEMSRENYRILAESLEQKVRERTEELKEAHLRLIQQEKMTAIGQLAAGVAHEVNNPLGFIISNLGTLRKYSERLLRVAESFRQAASGGNGRTGAEADLWQELKMDYVCGDIMPLITQSITGAERVKKIVSDLKGFSHVDDGESGVVDLNDEIDRTLRVIAHDIPPDAEIVREYGPLDPFPCNPGQICQVFLNIVKNAIQSRREGLRLLIRTGRAAGGPVITFTDNGPGIRPEIRTRIFEPFFTTRDVGSGQGLGLAVVYDIVSGYGGTVDVSCPDTGGTVFTIQLPGKRDLP